MVCAVIISHPTQHRSFQRQFQVGTTTTIYLLVINSLVVIACMQCNKVCSTGSS